jgi:hypothetical protein
MGPTTTIGRAVPLSPTARQPRGRIGLAESQTVSGGGGHSLTLLELERVLGVVDVDAEYVRARLADQFDAFVYFDETRSLEPLVTA